MNLFLLAAVPLAAVVFHRVLTPQREPFAEPRTWILGSIWSLVALLVVAPLGEWREYTGNLVAVAAGLVVTDALLVPGLVVGLWVFTRRKDGWDLALWLALVFTMAGVRDFAATSQVYDLNEYFLVPLSRIALVLVLPPLVLKAIEARTTHGQVLWAVAGIGAVLTGPLFQVLSFSGWGWFVWLANAAALAGGLWWQKKRAVPSQGGPVPLVIERE